MFLSVVYRQSAMFEDDYNNNFCSCHRCCYSTCAADRLMFEHRFLFAQDLNTTINVLTHISNSQLVMEKNH